MCFLLLLYLSSLLFSSCPSWWFNFSSLCPILSHSSVSASLPKDNQTQKKTRFWDPYFPLSFYCIFSLCHKIHWTFSCYPSLQSSFPASAWISSKLLFIFPGLHKLLSKFLALSWLYFKVWAVPWTFCCSFTYGFSILCCLPLPVLAAVFCGVSLSHCCPFS